MLRPNRIFRNGPLTCCWCGKVFTNGRVKYDGKWYHLDCVEKLKHDNDDVPKNEKSPEIDNSDQ